LALADSLLLHTPNERAAVSSALASARTVSSQLVSLNANIAANAAEFKIFQIQWHRILANSFACLAMFLIGAPLGSIIKKGGLGVPVLASILFFIVYYVLSLLGEKWAKQDLIPVPVGVWAADFILLVFGLIFLRQARRDARLFDADFYLIMWDRAQKWLVAKGLLRPSQA
jgi:lipopolysaccharide export system permease protein